jgi:hypothetical protein
VSHHVGVDAAVIREFVRSRARILTKKEKDLASR